MAKITKDMLIGEVVEKYPKTAEVFFKNGLQCLGCAMAGMETIEQGAKGHGMDIEKLMKELNEKLEEKK